ncbi:phosphate signaling complex protein PhoU [Kallotenue papyrolyticum]|uniref:phosphate signaling complex protein PhoU n=1 Tax=Kallotenue papyrolyticum TaxID=1325125 RepID=UPI00047857C7|nr:phosphate signaling complex protein PhoU [Kallotenue papyrolyticum]
MALRPHYLYALNELQRALLQLSEAVQQMIDLALRGLLRAERVAAERVLRMDDEIDERRRDIETRVLRLIAGQQPMASDLRFLLAALHIADELERIGDYAEGIARLALRSAALAEHEPLRLRELIALVQAMLRAAVTAFVERDAEAAARLDRDDDQVDRLTQALRAELIARIQAAPSAAPALVQLLFVTHNLERIADRAVNIAERTAFIASAEALRARRH